MWAPCRVRSPPRSKSTATLSGETKRIANSVSFSTIYSPSPYSLQLAVVVVVVVVVAAAACSQVFFLGYSLHYQSSSSVVVADTV